MLVTDVAAELRCATALPMSVRILDGRKKGWWSAEWIQLEERQMARPRSGSEPSGKDSDNLMDELRKLWTHDEPAVGVPLMRSDPYLSASHMTLDSYQVNMD
jgi:hypothetical protein